MKHITTWQIADKILVPSSTPIKPLLLEKEGEKFGFGC